MNVVQRAIASCYGLLSQWRNRATTGGNGGSRLRAPLERGRRVQTAMFFFILFNYTIFSRFVAANDTTQYTSPNTPMLYR